MFKRNPLFIVHLNNEIGIPPIPIFEKRFFVGRKPTHLVAIPDNSISRDHLEVIFQDNQIFIVDLGTSNGTKIDGHSIPANIPTSYFEGQVVSLGRSNVSLSIEIFDEDREKRKVNPSAKAIQNFNNYNNNNGSPNRTYQPFPGDDRSQSPQNSHQPSAPPVNFNPPIQQAPVMQQVQSQPEVQKIVTFQPSMPPNPSPQNFNQNNQQPPIFSPTSAATAAQPYMPQTPPVSAPPLFDLNKAQQEMNQDDAHRLIAKAKIDAEIAAREIYKKKEDEAQNILSKADLTAHETLKKAQEQTEQILAQANNDGLKLKNTMLEEAHREKERILSNVQLEKESVQQEIASLKSGVPMLQDEIEELKSQIQKFKVDKSSAETQLTQEIIRLEKLNSEIKSIDLHLTNSKQQLELNELKSKEAEENYKKTQIQMQSLIDETKSSHEETKAKKAEVDILINETRKEYEKAVENTRIQKLESDSYAKKTREEADQWAIETREKTESEVRKKMETLQQESAHLLSERERSYQTMKQQQESILAELKSTEQVKLKNLQEIDGILKRKADDFETAFRTRREALDSEDKARRDQIEKEFFDKREKLERELSDRRTGIERELLERRESLERESAEKKSSIEKAAQDLRAQRDKEYKDLKAQQDSYLIDVKKREEERLKAMVEDSRKAIREQFQNQGQQVKKSMEDFFVNYARTGPSSVREHLPDLQTQLNQILKNALNNELTGEDKHLRELLEYDPSVEKKHKRYWVRLAIGGVLLVATLTYLLYNPKKLSEGAEAITESVNQLDNENKKKQAAMLEQLKQAQIYHPQKDDTFKSSYTDNVLYTNRYIEFEKDDQYKSQWIVSIKEYLMQEAKLIDDKADELISKEGSLVIALDGEIPTIDGRNPEKGITRMREKENVYIELLSQYLNEDKKKVLREKKQAFYERYINDSTKIQKVPQNPGNSGINPSDNPNSGSSENSNSTVSPKNEAPINGM